MLKNEFKFEESYFIVFYLELKKKNWSRHVACGMAVPREGMGPIPLLEAWGLNH